MHGESFEPLLWVVGAAMVTGILLPRVQLLRIPMVVGEILIGIALGKSGFGVIPEEPNPWLELLSLFGFAFLMFLSGLEINFRSLTLGASKNGEGGLRQLLIVTFTIFSSTLIVSAALSYGLVAAGYIESPWIMALIMSTTSVGLVMPLLKERGEGATAFGQTVILCAVIADFTTMFLITVVVAFYEQEGATLDVLFVGTLFLLFFGVLWVGRRLLHHKDAFVRQLAYTAPKTAELPVRVAMTLMLGFVVFSEVIGSEIILGAFLAGTAVSSLSRRSVHGLLGMKLDAIGFGFFIPIFFIMVGARFDIQSLLADRGSLLLVPILVVFAFAVKVIPSLLLARFYGKKNAIAAGFLLSSRLSLIIAASAIGLRLGVITDEINTAIILVAIITCVVSPAVYAKLRGAPQEGERHAVDLDALIGHVVKKKSAINALELQLIEIDSDHIPSVIGHTLGESHLRDRTGLTLIAIVREDGSVVDNPGSEYVVASDDGLVLIGTAEQVERMEELALTQSQVA